MTALSVLAQSVELRAARSLTFAASRSPVHLPKRLPEPAAAGPLLRTPAKPVKHKRHKAKAKEVKTTSATNNVVVIDPPVTATVKCDVLDVRGQGSFAGEVITHVKKGDSVLVSEEITLAHAHAGEPQQWSRIAMPTNASLWVNADYIDPDTNTVRVKKVNVRGGPGENYSVVAQLDKGSVVKVLDKKEGWLQIEAPTNAYAFVASEYLEKQGAMCWLPQCRRTPLWMPQAHFMWTHRRLSWSTSRRKRLRPALLRQRRRLRARLTRNLRRCIGHRSRAINGRAVDSAAGSIER